MSQKVAQRYLQLADHKVDQKSEFVLWMKIRKFKSQILKILKNSEHPDKCLMIWKLPDLWDKNQNLQDKRQKFYDSLE